MSQRQKVDGPNPGRAAARNSELRMKRRDDQARIQPRDVAAQ